MIKPATDNKVVVRRVNKLDAVNAIFPLTTSIILRISCCSAIDGLHSPIEQRNCNCSQIDSVSLAIFSLAKKQINISKIAKTIIFENCIVDSNNLPATFATTHNPLTIQITLVTIVTNKPGDKIE